ncbi:MAG: HEAT repeat domain-containing protein [Verrucomicrobiota bacterium]
MLDETFDALKTYDWGVDPKILRPLDEAVVAAHGNAAACKVLEDRLIAVLKTDAPRAAKDAICRVLRTIGTVASVPALTALLADDKLSHMARYALERIPAPEAGNALRSALPKAAAKQQIGVLQSLGARHDATAIPALQVMLGSKDPGVAPAAARALGALALPAANKALASAKPTAAIADASMACAENLLAGGLKADAKATYQRVLASTPAKPVQFAATLGLKACAGG